MSLRQDNGLVEVPSPHLPGESEKNHEKTSFRMAGVPAKFKQSISEAQTSPLHQALALSQRANFAYSIIISYNVIQFIACATNVIQYIT
jgi:hypothetical protein